MMFASAMVGDMLAPARPDLLPLPRGFFFAQSVSLAKIKPEIPQGE